MPERLVFLCGRASQQPRYCLGWARGMRGGLEAVEGRTAPELRGHTPSLSVLGKFTFSPINYLFVLSPFFGFTFSASKQYPPKNYQ